MNEQDAVGMAPPDLNWHRKFAEAHMVMNWLLTGLQEHEAFQKAEDLGDWVEMLSTLLSFRPHTRDDIEATVREMFEEQIGQHGIPGL